MDKPQGPTVLPGNYIQYPIITYNGKESEKEYTHTRMYICVYICIYIAESLCYPPETNETL